MPRSKHLWVSFIGFVVVLLLVLVLMLKDNAESVSANALENYITKGLAIKLWIQDPYLYIQTKDTHIYKALLDQINPLVLKGAPLERVSTSWVIYSILVVLFLVVFGVAIMAVRSRKSRIKITPLNATPLQENLEAIHSLKPLDSNVRFSDVAGISEAKEELLEILDFLKNPAKYKALGINLPRGVLLAGAPGVGKTLLAKALAGESGVPFFYQSGASFVEMYVGVGAKRVRELFNAAKRNAPCIIFIDEIDAIGRKRSLEAHNTERESTLNQLLTEMDGFNDNSGIIVLGATNRIEILDSALLRSGRFDRKVFIELPNLAEREQILAMYLRTKPHNFTDQIPLIAQRTSGFSGAMLATLVNEAALNAVRRGERRICMEDFETLYAKIHSGKRRLPLLETKMRQVYALYQAGKIIYALHSGLALQKAGLFETLLVEPNPHTLSTKELFARLGFYLVGDRVVRIYVGDSFGFFGDDFALAKDLYKLGEKLGILYESPAEYFGAQSQNTVATLDSVALEHFVRAHTSPLITIAALLLYDERIHTTQIQHQNTESKLKAFVQECEKEVARKVDTTLIEQLQQLLASKSF